jgi:hypothetical protein
VWPSAVLLGVITAVLGLAGAVIREQERMPQELTSRYARDQIGWRSPTRPAARSASLLQDVRDLVGQHAAPQRHRRGQDPGGQENCWPRAAASSPARPR